jgi:hypothetical protein
LAVLLGEAQCEYRIKTGEYAGRLRQLQTFISNTPEFQPWAEDLQAIRERKIRIALFTKEEYWIIVGKIEKTDKGFIHGKNIPIQQIDMK